MRDNLRRYRAIRDALTQGYPGQPTGTVSRHWTTLAALISGIVTVRAGLRRCRISRRRFLIALMCQHFSGQKIS